MLFQGSLILVDKLRLHILLKMSKPKFLGKYFGGDEYILSMTQFQIEGRGQRWKNV